MTIALAKTYPDLRGDYVISPSRLKLLEAQDQIDLSDGDAA
jgi:hypothetical protein